MRVPVTMRRLITAPDIPNHPMVVPADIDRISCQPIIRLILRLHTALYGPRGRKGLRLETYHTRHSIGAILQAGRPPDNLGIINGVGIDQDTMFIAPLEIFLPLTVEKGQYPV